MLSPQCNEPTLALLATLSSALGHAFCHLPKGLKYCKNEFISWNKTILEAFCQLKSCPDEFWCKELADHHASLLAFMIYQFFTGTLQKQNLLCIVDMYDKANAETMCCFHGLTCWIQLPGHLYVTHWVNLRGGASTCMLPIELIWEGWLHLYAPHWVYLGGGGFSSSKKEWNTERHCRSEHCKVLLIWLVVSGGVLHKLYRYIDKSFLDRSQCIGLTDKLYR